MRILVYPHDLAMGGSQLNAIDLAAATRDRGHEVAVFGRRDTLVTRIEDLGLEFIESPRPRRRPTPGIVVSLRRTIVRRGVDVVHGYEWPPTLEAVLACRGSDAVAVSTVLSMSVPSFIPRRVPLMVGTEQILAAERAAGRPRVALMEPPIDTALNSPEARLPLQDFRREWGVDDGAFTAVLVSRLVPEMKLEGILSAMEAVRMLAPERTVQLLVVGGGSAEPAVRSRADRINARLGRRAVVVTGEMLDPRPAYAVADIALGMGSSALRAMAFGKPLVVQGIDGFWEPLDSRTLPTFLRQGWYGQGEGAAEGAARLAWILRRVIDAPPSRHAMGQLSLQTVRQRFSLSAAAGRQEQLYVRALAERDGGLSPDGWKDDAVALARFVRHATGRTVERLRGRQVDEDCNSTAVLLRTGGDAGGGGSPTRIRRAEGTEGR